jgi:hypothetical protein
MWAPTGSRSITLPLLHLTHLCLGRPFCGLISRKPLLIAPQGISLLTRLALYYLGCTPVQLANKSGCPTPNPSSSPRPIYRRSSAVWEFQWCGRLCLGSATVILALVLPHHLLASLPLIPILKQVIAKVKVVTELDGTDCSFCFSRETPGDFFIGTRLHWSQELSSRWETYATNSRIGALPTLMILSPYAYVHIHLQGMCPSPSRTPFLLSDCLRSLVINGGFTVDAL